MRVLKLTQKLQAINYLSLSKNSVRILINFYSHKHKLIMMQNMNQNQKVKRNIQYRRMLTESTTWPDNSQTIDIKIKDNDRWSKLRFLLKYHYVFTSMIKIEEWTIKY